MPWISRAPISIGIDRAAPPSARPMANSARPMRNGAMTPVRSIRLPAITIPTSDPTRKAENTRPYSSSPPRSLATIGIAVVTASASAATSVMVRTRPTVSGRRSGDQRPGSSRGWAARRTARLSGWASPSGDTSSEIGRAVSGITGVWPAPRWLAVGRSALRQPDRAVLAECPERVVRDLPGMPVGIDEQARVAAPEGRGAGSRDPCARCAGLVQERVHVRGRADVVGERHPAPTAAVDDGTVLCELIACPEAEDHAARLEEHDAVLGLGVASPAERLV